MLFTILQLVINYFYPNHYVPHSSHNYPGIITMSAFVRIGDVGKKKFHFTDWNQVFTEATIVSNGDPLALSVFYVPSMLSMYEY